MVYLLRFAYRNVFRFKRRSLICICSISLGLALLIILMSMLRGVENQSVFNIIGSQNSHISIFRQGYFEKRDNLPLDIAIKEPGRLRPILKDIPGVCEVESRIVFGASVIKGPDELICQGVAIEPELDPDVFKIKASLEQGQWLEPGDTKILVGRDLADDMGLSVGEVLTVRMILSTKTGEFTWNAVDMEIKGIYAAGNPIVDKQWLILPIRQAREALSLGDEATEIAVRLNLHPNDTQGISRIKEKIKERLDAQNPQQNPLEIYTWKDLSAPFLALTQMKTRRNRMITFIMLFIASMGIINVMLMAVLERSREIGMLGALGMKKSEILRLFVFEGGFIGVFGSILGCLIGGLTAWYLEVKGIAFIGHGSIIKKIIVSVYPLKDVFHAELTWELILATFLLGTGISIIAGFYPALSAAKLNPIDTLKQV